jgi:hypothetical protein
MRKIPKSGFKKLKEEGKKIKRTKNGFYVMGEYEGGTPFCIKEGKGRRE